MDPITPTIKGSRYIAFAGMADFLLQGLLVGASGSIVGGANAAQIACVKVPTCLPFLSDYHTAQI